MFDNAHPVEISGTVKEFRYVNPHSVLIVEVKGTDGTVREWTLECPAPGIMGRQGSKQIPTSRGILSRVRSVRYTVARQVAPTFHPRSI
jgi:hypothetical protein